jgi:two-component system, cell cycle sensor histidine kinase and response regulator CckA
LPTQQNIARDDAITAIRFPIRLLTVACLLTIMAFAWFVWIIFDARRDAVMFTDRLSRIEELRGVIVHLDEVLTMSARMAAATGDLRWEERYHHFEPQLNAAIKEIIKIGASSSKIKAATKTDEANIKLVEMENRAFALVRAGRKEEAQTVLFSPEYETQKQIYAEGITSFTSQIRREFDESLRDDQRIDLLSIIAAVVVGGISLVAWLSAARGVRRWRARLLDSLHQRAEAEENLRKAHANLEVRVQERTADLANTNETLQAEISERKRAEEQLRVQATALDAAANAIVITDHNGTIQSVNPAFTALTGYTAQEAVGQNPRFLKGGKQDDAFYRKLWQTISSGQVWNGELTNRRKDGSLYAEEMTITPLRNADGVIARYIAIKQDITARKELEAQMERLRTEHALILNSIGEGVHWIDVDGRIKFENPAAAKMLGYEVSELIGKPAHSTMHHTRADGAAYPQSECLIYATLRDGVVRRVTDEVFWRKDGSSFAVEYLCTPIYDKNGRSGGSVVIFADITGRKRLEAQLFQSQKLETVGKLAGGVAHEFNSIMTAIIGHSELILGDLPSGHPLTQNAAGIRRAAERAATLTRQLLAYGRRAFLRPESLDLNQVMASTEGMVRQLMGGDVDMRIVPAEGLRAVKADAGQIEQVIMNLAMNARDAMPNGGKLTLETANVSFDQERVGRDPELKPGDYVMLAITDTGTGMSAEVKARAFEPFFTTKGVGQGTGLGLSTCYGIIKQSGGHISVYTELGRGTTFKIYLPQVESQTKIPLQRLDSPDLPRGTETILLVEDDPALREMAATLLRRLGYTVLAAANGIEALSLKQQRDRGHIDLLFTDVVMPHMSGKELADRVQALHPHTRILFTSAYTENAIVHQGVLNPGVALLQKPFTPSALAHKLREVLDQPGTPKPDPTQKTSGFTKISDEAKTLVN